MLVIIIAIVSGIISGMGMGGGSILILLFTLFMNIDQHIAQGTNLIFFVPTAVIATIINFKQKYVDLKLAIPISIFGIGGAIIGAKISVNMQAEQLKKYFAIFILLIGLYEIYDIWKKYISKKNILENKSHTKD